MIRYIYITFLLLILSPDVWAQKEVDRSRELKVGQELPSLSPIPLINYETDEIGLRELNDKVIILDFFDTYCSNCIRDMPKLQKLQDALGDQLQIVLITWQDREVMEKFYDTNGYLKEHKVHLPTIYGDTLLRKYFPHKGVPHTAWLYQNRVQAITFADFSTAENVQKLYADGSIQLPLKSDFAELNDQMESNTLGRGRIGSVELTGYIDGIPSGGLKIEYDSINNTTISSISNLDILGAYTSTWAKIKKPEYLLKDGRIIWNVQNPNRYRDDNNGSEGQFWLLGNAINYLRTDPFLRSEEEIARLILQDLNTFLGLKVYWDKREISCLILQKLDTNEDIYTGENKGAGGTGMLTFMVDYQTNFPPVYDGVNSSQKINVDDYSSLYALNKQLEKYGLILVEGIRKMEVLIIEEVP